MKENMKNGKRRGSRIEPEIQRILGIGSKGEELLNTKTLLSVATFCL